MESTKGRVPIAPCHGQCWRTIKFEGRQKDGGQEAEPPGKFFLPHPLNVVEKPF